MKHLLLTLCAFLICLSGNVAQAQGLTNDVIKIKVNKKAGEQIKLYMEAEGDITIEGVSNGDDFKTALDISYTLTAQEVQVKGSVKRFKCIENKVTSFDAHDHPTLADIELQKNEITKLILENCPNVFWLNFGDNNVSEYRISGLPLLETLYFKNNRVSKIDLSQFPLLRRVICENNLITEKNMEEMVEGIADRTGKDAMGLFYATYPAINDNNVLNAVSSAILKGKNWQPYIREGNLWVYDPGRDVSDAIVLNTNKKKGDKITLKLSGKDKPRFYGIGNPESFADGEAVTYDLTSPWIVIRGELTGFDCENEGIITINAATNATLQTLRVQNDITEKIDVRECKQLKTLSCDSNRLSELKYNGLPQLSKLSCKGNRILSATLSDLPNLEQFDCSQNVISTLKLDKVPMLNRLECHENQLRGKAIDDIIEHLPTFTGEQKGSLYVLNSDEDENTELNLCNTIQVKALREKGWKVYHLSEGKWVEYEGSEPMKPAIIKMTTAREKGGWILLLIKSYGNVTINGVSDPELFINGDACLYTLNGQEVTVEGDITYFDCSNNELKSLELTDCVLLKELSCYDNELQKIKFDNCTSLSNVVCEKNKIQAPEMQLLVDGLPDRNGDEQGRVNLYNADSYKEFNQCSTEQVEALHRKNWEVFQTVDGYVETYEGLTLAVQAVTDAAFTIRVDRAGITISGAPAHAVIELYNINGERLRTLSGDAEGHATIGTEGLSPHHYILRVGNNAYKVIL